MPKKIAIALTVVSASAVVIWMINSGWLTSNLRAQEQPVSGIPASGTRVLPVPGPPFCGVIDRKVKDSKPDFPKAVTVVAQTSQSGCLRQPRARCIYSGTVPRPIEQLRASAAARPTSNFNRRASWILHADNLLTGKRSSLSCGRCRRLCCQAPLACEIIPDQSRTRFRDRPKTVRLYRGMELTFIPESCSSSPRNTVRNHPGIAFTFAGFARS
jgi:hypothetical protein